MSHYGDYTSTTHQQAYPPAKWSTYQHPPPPRFTSQYGPPPPVPASLHHSSYAATPPHQQRQYIDTYGHAGPSKSNRGRDYLKSLGSGMAALNIESQPQRTHLPAVSPVPVDGRLSFSSGSGSDKPLPRLPPPPPLPPQLAEPPLLLARPATEVLDAYPALAPAPPVRARPVPQPVKPLDPYSPTPRHSKPVQKVSPPKSFKPSPYLHLPLPPSTPPSRHRPHSAPHPGSSSGKGKGRGDSQEVIDLTLESPSSPTVSTPSSPSHPRAHVTPRSPARLRRRGASDQPPPSTSTPTHTPLQLPGVAQVPATPSRSSQNQRHGSPSSTAVRCAGYTRAGERCKRTVKVEAPYLAAWNLNVGSGMAGPSGNMAGPSGKNKGKAEAEEGTAHRRQNRALVADRGSPDEADDEVEGGRYCKDHAGMICGVEGFYSRDKPGLWIRFVDMCCSLLHSRQCPRVTRSNTEIVFSMIRGSNRGSACSVVTSNVAMCSVTGPIATRLMTRLGTSRTGPTDQSFTTDDNGEPAHSQGEPFAPCGPVVRPPGRCK